MRILLARFRSVFTSSADIHHIHSYHRSAAPIQKGLRDAVSWIHVDKETIQKCGRGCFRLHIFLNAYWHFLISTDCLWDDIYKVSRLSVICVWSSGGIWRPWDESRSIYRVSERCWKVKFVGKTHKWKIHWRCSETEGLAQTHSNNVSQSFYKKSHRGQTHLKMSNKKAALNMQKADKDPFSDECSTFHLNSGGCQDLFSIWFDPLFKICTWVVSFPCLVIICMSWDIEMNIILPPGNWWWSNESLR